MKKRSVKQHGGKRRAIEIPFLPTLRVHLGHVLDGGGDAEVVALGVLELAADALDLVLAGARPQRGGERAERAQACM